MKIANPSGKSIERNRVIDQACGTRSRGQIKRFATEFFCQNCSSEFFFIIGDKIDEEFPKETVRRIACGVCYAQFEIVKPIAFGDVFYAR